MVESDKQVSGSGTTLPSASHTSDAHVTVSPGRKGAKRYTVRWWLDDGGPGHSSVLTVFYRTAGGTDSHSVKNRGTGRLKGSFTIRTTSAVKAMWARVERMDSHESQTTLRASDPNVFS